MKNPILLLAIAILALCSPTKSVAQPEKVEVLQRNKNVQKQKPLENSTRNREFDSVPLRNGALGKFSHKWVLEDGTTVSSVFDLGSVQKTGRPNNKAKVQERNAQDSSEGDWECVTKEIRISLENDDYMTVDNLDQMARVYPGAIYKFDNYVEGSWLDETKERNPITISTSAIGVSGQTYLTVEDPDKPKIRNAVNTLTGRLRSEANGAFKMRVKEVNSQADASLMIGASGNGFGFSASYLFNFNTVEHKKYFLIDCVQELFLVDTEIPDGGFFQSPDRATRDMMFVGSVTYGVRVLASIETTISSRETSHKLNASYSYLVAGGEAGLDAYMKELASTSMVKMYVIGGPQQGTYPVSNQAELLSVIQGIFKNGTYATAQPIKYSLRDMTGEMVSSHSTTDYFLTQNCTLKEECLYTVKLLSVKRGNDDDDWELYGQIWAQVYDANGREIGSIHGNDRLLDIKEQNRLNDREGWGSGYAPGLEVSFKIPPSQIPGATMTIWYWLNDYDSGSGNDLLSMRNGNMGRYKNGDQHFYRRIPLSDMQLANDNSQKSFIDTFTDEDGDSFTEVNGEITCGLAK